MMLLKDSSTKNSIACYETDCKTEDLTDAKGLRGKDLTMTETQRFEDAIVDLIACDADEWAKIEILKSLALCKEFERAQAWKELAEYAKGEHE